MTTGRRVSREPYRVRRDRREIVVAVAVAALIILATVVSVWLLAPDDESTPDLDTPNFTLPTDTTPTTETTVSTEPPATTVAPGG
jgi:hypothetical protein